MGKIHEALRKATGPARGRGVPDRSDRGAGDAEMARVAARFGSTSGSRDLNPNLVTLAGPHSPIAEQYRTLKTNVLAASNDSPVKIVVVTSGVPGEGKGVTSVNLACVLAEDADKQVVIVDADLRKPDVQNLLGLDNQRGLSDYLAGGTMLEMVLQRSRLPNLWALPSGQVPPNPAELLAGKRMDDLLARLRRDYDYVVIDTPPVISTSDAGVLAPRVDGTLLVVRMGETPRQVARQAAELLAKARANVLGTVLTGLDSDLKDYFYYPYGAQER